jgi:hypothetical protein
MDLLLNSWLGLPSARQAKGGFKRGRPDAAGMLIGPVDLEAPADIDTAKPAVIQGGAPKEWVVQLLASEAG